VILLSNMLEPERIRIILQARTNSRRLPGKVLLPIGGFPLAILCAKRLESCGRELILATSNEPSDDILAESASCEGVQVFRGSLDNVIKRFYDCTIDLKDDDVIIRTTADNPLPDGEFIEKMISLFRNSNSEYLGTSSPSDGLPYGLSAEIFTVRALRKVVNNTIDSSSREHVTPQLRKNAGKNGCVQRGVFTDKDYSHLRVTIDTLDDYLNMATLFRHIICPTTLPWHQILHQLLHYKEENKKIPYKIMNNSRFSCLTLGTAQFGLDYGITNRSGRPEDNELCKILCIAVYSGIMQIDTARAYGDAESRIGKFIDHDSTRNIRIITKLKSMDNIPEDASLHEVECSVDASVFCSCRELQRSKIDTMMFHRYDDTVKWGGSAVERLSLHMKNGIIGEIGVSVYTPQEAIFCMDDKRITNIQIPFNLLDNRWIGDDFVQALKKRRDLKIHARSIFLQGLLLNKPDFWPQWANESHDLVQRIEELTESLNRKSKIDLCISYVRSFPWITSLVIGVENATQLAEIVSLMREPPMSSKERIIVHKTFREVNDRLLNPSLW